MDELLIMCKTIRNLIRETAFKGVNFYDITPLLADRFNFRYSVGRMLDFFEDKTDLIICPESRGFIYGAAIANELSAGFLPVRKKGKLPIVGGSFTYKLEYGTDTLEIPEINWADINNIVCVDDILATGGTCEAIGKLIEKMGKRVAKYVFLAELTVLRGRDKLNAPVESLVKY